MSSARAIRPSAASFGRGGRITYDGSPQRVERAGPSTPGLDRNTARRLSKGRRAPDARIDLHGMTAERAHSALLRFIAAEHASGSRMVLVITGKGKGDVGGGVLRRQTPHWLGQPPIGALVVGIYEAHISHGGGGALYVYLRKNR